METSTWVFVALVAWALGLLFVLIWVRNVRNEDRSVRDEAKRIDQDADVATPRRDP